MAAFTVWLQVVGCCVLGGCVCVLFVGFAFVGFLQVVVLVMIVVLAGMLVRGCCVLCLFRFGWGWFVMVGVWGWIACFWRLV